MMAFQCAGECKERKKPKLNLKGNIGIHMQFGFCLRTFNLQCQAIKLDFNFESGDVKLSLEFLLFFSRCIIYCCSFCEM